MVCFHGAGHFSSNLWSAAREQITIEDTAELAVRIRTSHDVCFCTAVGRQAEIKRASPGFLAYEHTTWVAYSQVAELIRLVQRPFSPIIELFRAPFGQVGRIPSRSKLKAKRCAAGRASADGR